MNKFKLAAAVIVATLTVTVAAPAHATVTPPPVTATALLDLLEVADPIATKYSRTAFKHWVDVDKNGLNTRAEVLKAESTTPVVFKSTKSKTIISGTWYSPYDGVTYVKPTKLDIDHLVPLAEAHRSGANTWTAAERQAYANDLGYARSLIAVGASPNRSKSDQDPTTWLPTNASYRCAYIADWVAVKYRWSLTIDPAEKTAITNVLVTCDITAITIETPPIAKILPVTDANTVAKANQMVTDFITTWATSTITYTSASQKFTAGIDANKDGALTGKEVKAALRVPTNRYTVLIAGAPATSNDLTVLAADQYAVKMRFDDAPIRIPRV